MRLENLSRMTEDPDRSITIHLFFIKASNTRFFSVWAMPSKKVKVACVGFPWEKEGSH